MKKYGVIYILINKINGKCYIGQTVNYQERIYKYYKLNCKSQIKLYNALQIYGWNNFSHEIIESINGGIISLNLAESAWIRNLYTVEFGYNCNYGGLNKKTSEETKSKLSYAKSGVNNPMYGKISARKGVILSKIIKEKMSNSHYKKPIFCNELQQEFKSMNDAAKQLKIKQGHITEHLQGKRRRVKSSEQEYFSFSLLEIK